MVVFSGTEEGNDFYRQCIPNAYIHAGIDIEKLKSIIEVQRKIIGSCKEAEEKTGCPNRARRQRPVDIPVNFAAKEHACLAIM